MRLITTAVLVSVLMWAPLFAQSVFSEAELTDPAQAKVFKELTVELRCLVCQNQNIADSDAELAQDLRREIRTMLGRGDSKKQIIDFMVERYGEFVLYRPLFSVKTLLLWLGPLLFFVCGVLLVWRQARKPATPAFEPDDAALARARDLLASKDNNHNHKAP